VESLFAAIAEGTADADAPRKGNRLPVAPAQSLEDLPAEVGLSVLGVDNAVPCGEPYRLVSQQAICNAARSARFNQSSLRLVCIMCPQIMVTCNDKTGTWIMKDVKVLCACSACEVFLPEVRPACGGGVIWSTLLA
jgi:hypothetical protein